MIHISSRIPSLVHVKKLDDQSDGPLIKLEWGGMQCSGKYDILTKVDDCSTERLSISVDESKQLCNWHYVWAFCGYVYTI